MPNLFNYNLIKSYTEKYQIDDYERKLKVIQDWKKNLETIKGTSEKALQSAFLQGIFGIVLGYKGVTEASDGKWNINIETSTEVDKTTPDGILGFYSPEHEETQVIIELKAPKYSLDNKQKRAGKDYGTPVEQAFSYVYKYDRCKWVIVSNMIETRLYKVGRSQEYYETFWIEELDKEEEFKKFHLLLCKDNLIDEGLDSFSLKLSERTKEHVEDISVKFYNLYRDVRIRLFEELKSNNPNYDEELLLEKAQKFLDRIIFICFCEDMRLLPNDLLHRAIERGKNSFSDIVVWQEIKGVFNAIDVGSDKHNIPPYDGGLFKHDEILDNLIIKNDFFDAIYDFSAYDFNSDLDVNILGHIFEQSIADIENLKAEIQKGEYDVQQSRRKKEGIYYTPGYITKYIVENSLGKYLEEIRKELGEENLPDIDSAPTVQVEGKYRKQLIKFYQEYEERVMQVKVLDPACGSGAFLNQAFDFLLEEYRWIHEQISRLREGQLTIFDNEVYQRSILHNNLYGVDINEESVEITKLSLWLKTADSRKALPYLDNNIKCGNSLIDDPQVAGDKAFNWYKEFPVIMKNGGFDVIIGNPPYVRQEQLHDYKDYLSTKYKAYNNSADIYCYFIEKGITLVKENGYFSYIVSSKFTRTKYGKPLRSFLLNYQVEEYRGFDNKKVFTGATVDPCILTIKKTPQHPNQMIKYNLTDIVPQKQLNPEIWSFITLEQWSLMKKIETKGTSLKSWNINITRGILTGLHDVFVIDEAKKKELLDEDPASEEIIKPLLRGRDIKRYEYNFSNKYLLATGYDIDIPTKYPAIYNYLYKFKDKAVKRYDKGKNWWNLRKFDYYNEFENEMIVWIELTDKPNFTIVKSFYIAQTLFFMTGSDLYYLLPVLNSKLICWYFNNISTSSGVGTNRWIKYKIEQIPIPIPSQHEKENIENKAKDMLSLKDKLKYNSQKTFTELTTTFLSKQMITFKDIIESSNFYNPTANVKTNKINGFSITANNEVVTMFVGTTSKQKKELLKFEVKDYYKRQYLKLFLENLTEEQLAEINQYEGNILDKVMQIKIPDYDKPHVIKRVVDEWNQLQKEKAELEEKIERTDKEIDQMVYDLYGLNEEEIKIVEENI